MEGQHVPGGGDAPARPGVMRPPAEPAIEKTWGAGLHVELGAFGWRRHSTPALDSRSGTNEWRETLQSAPYMWRGLNVQGTMRLGDDFRRRGMPMQGCETDRNEHMSEVDCQSFDATR